MKYLIIMLEDVSRYKFFGGCLDKANHIIRNYVNR